MVFSGLTSPRESPPRQILGMGRRRELDIWLSPFIVLEVEKIFRYKTAFSSGKMQEIIRDLRGIVTLIEPQIHIQVIQRKPSDNRILECAVAAQAEYLVSGDKKDLLPLRSIHGIPILSPREFLSSFPYPSGSNEGSGGMRVGEKKGNYEGGKRRAKTKL